LKRDIILRVLLLITLPLLFTEVFFYPGIILNYFKIQPYSILIFYSLIKIVDRVVLRGKPFSSFFKLGLFYIGPILAVLVTTLDLAERMLYGNFVFSHFHVHP